MECDPSLAKTNTAPETHYRHKLEELGKEDGMLGIIFRKAQNKIQDPAKLKLRAQRLQCVSRYHEADW